jgi:hypothetical protein
VCARVCVCVCKRRGLQDQGRFLKRRNEYVKSEQASLPAGGTVKWRRRRIFVYFVSILYLCLTLNLHIGLYVIIIIIIIINDTTAHFLSLVSFVLYTVGRTRWARHQPVARPLPTHTITVPRVGVQPTTRTFEWAKTLRALHRAASVGCINKQTNNSLRDLSPRANYIDRATAAFRWC